MYHTDHKRSKTQNTSSSFLFNTTKLQMNRKRDITIGLLFISAFPLYGVGSSLLETAPSSESSSFFHAAAGIGLLLVLSNSAVVLVIGRMLKEIVAPIDKAAAVIYFYARLVEALLLAFSASLIFHSHHHYAAGEINGGGPSPIAPWCYRVAMLGLGMGSFPLLISVMKAKAIPAWLGWSGMVGYSCVIVGILADSVGAKDLGLLFMIPGAFFEITFAIWLIFRGFQFDGYESL